MKTYLFYATTVNVPMGFMPWAYSHGAYYFLTFLFSFQDDMNLINLQTILNRKKDNYQVYLLARRSVFLSPPNGTLRFLNCPGICWVA